MHVIIELNFTREDTSKAISLLNKLIDWKASNGLILVLTKERGRRVHVASHAKPATSFFTNSKLITSDHLNVHSQIESTPYGLSTVMPWWVKKWQQTNKRPRSSCTLLTFFWHFLLINSRKTISK